MTTTTSLTYPRGSGATISGTHDAALTVILCVGGTYDPTPLPKTLVSFPYNPADGPFDAGEFLASLPDRFCAGGMTYAAEGGLGMPVGTTWSVELDTAAINAAGEGSVPLTAIATDGGGNITVSPSHDLIVDTIKPTAVSARPHPSTTRIIVNVSEPLGLINLDGSEFTLAGSTAVVTAVSTAGTTLTLTLNRAITTGESNVMLTWTAGTGDSIVDRVGNSMDDFSLALTRDDLSPTINTPISGDNIVVRG